MLLSDYETRRRLYFTALGNCHQVVPSRNDIFTNNRACRNMNRGEPHPQLVLPQDRVLRCHAVTLGVPLLFIRLGTHSSSGLDRHDTGVSGLSFEGKSHLFDKMSDALLQWCVDQLHHKFGLEACEDIVQ